MAEEVSAHSVECSRLGPLLDRTTANLGAIGAPAAEQTPEHFRADAGSCSEPNLAELDRRGIDAYVATGRERHHRATAPAPKQPRTP